MITIQCKHYEGDGYNYHLGEEEICLCEDCHEVMFAQMVEQVALERNLERDPQYKEIMRKIEDIK